MKRELIDIPFDKVFETENGREFCHSSGYEVCFGNPENPANWWNEYEDSNGNFHYGR